jgi:S-formylglutathione hydrolase FrmB
VAWAVCFHEPPDADPSHLLIHFHGRRGNEAWWNDAEAYSGELYEVWRAQRVRPPIVASVSFGPLWLLVNQASEGPTLSLFEREVLPRIEASLRQPVARRSVVGESMGGVNALMVGVRGERFQRAAALCPPIYEASPATGPFEIPSLARRLGLSPSQALLVTGLARRLYPDESVWRASDPLQALTRTPRTAFYVTCGAADPWRCMPGATRFADTVRGLGGSVDWVPRPGGHCDVDVESLARFLVPQ